MVSSGLSDRCISFEIFGTFNFYQQDMGYVCFTGNVEYKLRNYLIRFFTHLLFLINYIFLLFFSFQFFNVIILLFESIYYYMPNIWIVFAVVLWEGLLGGAAYVNTFYRMSTEVMRLLLKLRYCRAIIIIISY